MQRLDGNILVHSVVRVVLGPPRDVVAIWEITHWLACESSGLGYLKIKKLVNAVIYSTSNVPFPTHEIYDELSNWKTIIGVHSGFTYWLKRQ